MQQSRVCHEKPELSRELQDHPRTASPAEYLGNREDLRIEEKILGLHDIVEYYLHIVVKGLKKKKKRKGRGEEKGEKEKQEINIQLCSELYQVWQGNSSVLPSITEFPAYATPRI